MSLNRSLQAHHASSREVEALFLSAGELESEESVIRHLLEGCTVCLDTSAALWSSRFSGRTACPPPVASSDSSASPDAGSPHDGIFGRIESRVLKAQAELDRERAEARRQLPRLLRQPIDRQLLLVTNSRALQTWSTCELLLEESFKLRFEDPKLMAALARVAVATSAHLPEAQYGAGRVRDFQARCWLGLGNAQRVVGDFGSAEASLQRAESLLAQGLGDPLDQATWLDVHSSLLIARRRFRAADASMGLASRLYYSVGQKHALGSALIKRSFINESLDEFERAIVLARAGLDLVDVDRDSSVAVGGWLNVIRALHFSGRAREALAALERARPLYVRQRDRTTLLRFQWMEGLIAHSLGRDEQAEGCLGEAREGFLRLGLAHDAALVSLDLAELLAALGRLPEVRRLAAEMIHLFRVGEAHTEVIAAMILLRQAADNERVTRSLLARMAASLRQAPVDG